jgi:acyl-CoA synthetase (AMP-forming)/AMP-acid ligase II
MPGCDGKAGMAAIVRDEAETLDINRLAGFLRMSLPKYAVPIFIRLVPDFEWTATHKIKKSSLKNEGFDPLTVGDGLYILLPGSEAYTLLTKEVHSDIRSGRYWF